MACPHRRLIVSGAGTSYIMNLLHSHKKCPLQWRAFLIGEVRLLASCEVRECAVGFGHLVGVFFFLEGSTGFVVGVDDFSG